MISNSELHTRLMTRDYYKPFIMQPTNLGISVQPIPFTDTELKTFDRVLGLKRSAQKSKMRRVFDSCGMTETHFTRSGKRKQLGLSGEQEDKQ